MIATGCLFTCGRSRLSDRETRREQIRLNAEMKKRELNAIKGDYAGLVNRDGAPDARGNDGRNAPRSAPRSDSQKQRVSLHLEVIEVPFNDNGGIDPVMMPQLSGFLKFPFGSTSGDEYLSFKITRGEYDPKRSALELVVNHGQYGDMNLSMTSMVGGFAGHWQALNLSANGTMTLIRDSETLVTDPASGDRPPGTNIPLTGSYVGFVNDDERGVSYSASIQLRATNMPGQGMKLSADIQLARGTESSEFAIWKFDPVEFHPVTQKLTLRKDGVNESFLLTYSDGSMTGEWSSATLGRLGAAKLDKRSTPRSSLPPAHPRSGLHEVCLKNFGGANLPPNAALSTTVTPDVNGDGKVRTQASVVFYLGGYGSSERYTCVLEQIVLDYISGRFQGVCRSIANTEPFTVTGAFGSTGFDGQLLASGASGAKMISGRCSEDSP
jgi:hypothetical protein